LRDGKERGVKVGIPRAVHFYQHYPLWQTFLEELGAETVVSPPTNRDILTAGAMLVADVTCLPVKVYAGHVCWLRDRADVDFIFSPAIWDLQRNAFHCAKLKALPDIMQANVPRCPPLLVADVDPYHRGLKTDAAFRQVGRQLTPNARQIDEAWVKARQVDEAYRALIVREQLTYPEAIARLYGAEWSTIERIQKNDAQLTVGLVGHPYCLYDDYVNHNLIRCLSQLGVHVVTGEMVPEEAAQRGIRRTTRDVRWFYDSPMSGAAGHFLFESDVDGVMAVLAFGCGTDSTMVETIIRRAHALQRPCLSLVLDEHGSATGMLTRLEAFVDLLSWRQRHTGRQGRGGARTMEPDHRCLSSPAQLTHIDDPVIGVPSMGTLSVAAKSMFESIGAQVEMGPPASKRTWDLGARSSPEFMCTPYKQILGNMIEMLDAGANTLVYIDAVDACRTSSYHQLMEDALLDLGYKFRLTVFSEVLDGGVFALPRFLRRFAPEKPWKDILGAILLALEKIRALDDIERKVQYIRPREASPGEVDELWQQAINRVDEARSKLAVRQTMADMLQKMHQVECDPNRRPVRIGLTGEMFASLDPFYNQDIERELSRAGAEVHRTLMISNWMRAEMILAAMGLPIYGDLQRATRRYMRTNVVGPTLGDTVLCAERGFDGMVEMLPFTCMPHITALNILPRVIQDYDIPVLTFIFDEQSARAGMQARVEAFVDLLYRRRQLRESSAYPVPQSQLPRRTSLGEDVCGGCPVLGDCRRRNPADYPAQCALNQAATQGSKV
jgi:predicted nucleotide-binding protein (sugar kinase/HSP70/actin superfamily)